MNITFREAETSDLEFLTGVEKLSFPPHRQNNSKSLRLSVISTFQEVWMAEIKDKGIKIPIADAILYPHKRTLRIFSIAVMPQFRGKGIGHKFIEKIKDIARSKGCLSISLESDSGNGKLVKWYVDHGFAIKEHLNDYYGPGEDAVRMFIPIEYGNYLSSHSGSAIRNFIVVDNPARWSLEIDTAEVVSAKDYITSPRFQNIPNARIFNMCNSYRYQSLGYYVSLLASARDHRAMPNVTTIRDITNMSLIRNIADGIDDLIQTSLKDVKDNYFCLIICFGQTLRSEYRKLSKEIYQLFESPVLKVSFAKSKDWSIRKIAPVPLESLREFDQLQVEKFAKEYFAHKRYKRHRIKTYFYDLAILIDPAEKYPPSDKKALDEFKKAAEEVGFYTEFITKKDYDRIPEFDALFIRETTSVNDHTYLFSRRAYAEGLVVIDDPWSVMRCSNKMFLFEKMTKGRVLMPKTWMLTKGIPIEKQLTDVQYPLVLKQPDGSFSKDMFKVKNFDELKEKIGIMYNTSDLIVAQQFIKSEFDWRIGILDGSPLFASKYYMAPDHWQIYNWDNEDKEELHTGDFETLPVNLTPKEVISTAVKAAGLIGDGLYGIDLKEVGGKVYLIEINDNPNFDYGIEDKVLGNELYQRIMRSIFSRIEKQRGVPKYVSGD